MDEKIVFAVILILYLLFIAFQIRLFLLLVKGFKILLKPGKEKNWKSTYSLGMTLGIIILTICIWVSGEYIFSPLIFVAKNYYGNYLIETIKKETPQSKISSYLESIKKGNLNKAFEIWLPPNRAIPEYEERRQSIARELQNFNPNLKYKILNIEWWRTCCEPAVILQSREAGFARILVEIRNKYKVKNYIFDVKTSETYWGEVKNWPVRYWKIVDIYPEGKEPIYWKLK